MTPLQQAQVPSAGEEWKGSPAVIDIPIHSHTLALTAKGDEGADAMMPQELEAELAKRTQELEEYRSLAERLGAEKAVSALAQAQEHLELQRNATYQAVEREHACKAQLAQRDEEIRGLRKAVVGLIDEIFQLYPEELPEKLDRLVTVAQHAIDHTKGTVKT